MIEFLVGLSLFFIIIDLFLRSKVLTLVGFTLIAIMIGSVVGNSWFGQLLFAIALWASFFALQYWVWFPLVEKLHQRLTGSNKP